MDIKNTDNFTPLSDDELDRLTGGAGVTPPVAASPVAGTPPCFCGRKNRSSLHIPARCNPHTRCSYFDECKNPGKKKTK